MTVGASNVNSVTAFPRAPARRRARSSRPERVGQQLAQRPRAQRMVDQHLRAAVLQQHLPAPPARHQHVARRRPHTTARSACRRRRNAGRRPLRTRHRDQGHMRHSPHCSRPPSGRSSTSAAAPTGNPEYGAYACAAASVALCRNIFQSISDVMSTSPNRILNAFRSPPSRSSTREVGNPNFRVLAPCERLNGSSFSSTSGFRVAPRFGQFQPRPMSPPRRSEPKRPPMALEAR